MRCPTLAELPPPPSGKTGWPWTEDSPAFPSTQPNGAPWPKIGVVTPSFNLAGYLEQSIRSILLQGYPDLEYIVIDGGSTDESLAIIRKYERWITFWTSEPDRGCSDASAKGLARTNAELLGVMNADDYFAPGAFAILMALRAANPHHVLWGGGGPGLDLAGKRIFERTPYIRDQKKIGNWGVDAWFFSPGCLFDGATYRAVGGFDPRFYNAGDLDLWIRMSKIGTFVLTPETVVYVHFNPDSVSGRDRLGGDIALISSNYLHGNYDIARAKMTTYIKKWIQSPDKNSPRAPDSTESILALAPMGSLFRALLRHMARSIWIRLRKPFQRRS
ncbi:MAG TPA: glycosyltransferase family 2 protein [Opitutales bacterium]|jgi:glycosyltransferase involved in cell wall biosynthesis|nr:glycosyltransferase family 2 protein [Opitutales bacterium]